MKKSLVVFTLAGIFLGGGLILAAMHFGGSYGCGGGSGSSGGSGDQVNTFSNSGGGTTLTTAVSTTGTTSKTVTVTDANGATVATLVVTLTGATLSAPGQTDTSMTFRDPLTELPTDYAAKRMALFAAGPMATASSLSVRADSPGCDWFPDTQCTLGCCADHDKCYQDNSCGASSWIWGFGSDACKNCNNIAYDCIAAACAGVTESFTVDNCYDHACAQKYDCPPDRDNCDCTSPCTATPSTCGDGICVEGENIENCKTDCGAGTSASECCTSRRCPDETGSSCGSCGCPSCCGEGYACDWHVNAAATQNTCVQSLD